MKRTEIYWLLGTLGLSMVLIYAIFGAESLKAWDTALDINVHDTYFVFAFFHSAIIVLVFTFFTVSLIRSLKQHFKNLTVNLTLIISTILLILLSIDLSAMINTANISGSGWTVYPPLSAGEGIPQIEEEIVYADDTADNTVSFISSIVFLFQLMLLILLVYCGFKTGLHYKTRERKD